MKTFQQKLLKFSNTVTNHYIDFSWKAILKTIT